jgi:hypothetical protein
MKKMKKMMKNMVCMLLCAVMALSVITIPEKVTAETTTKNTLYRYREVKTGKFGCVNRKGKVIVLEPLSKFPVVKDLIVDRSVVFENLKKINLWLESDL